MALNSISWHIVCCGCCCWCSVVVIAADVSDVIVARFCNRPKYKIIMCVRQSVCECVCVYIVSVDLFVNYTPQKQQLSKCCCSSRQHRRRRRRCWRRLPLLPEKVLTAGVRRARVCMYLYTCMRLLSVSLSLSLSMYLYLSRACSLGAQYGSLYSFGSNLLPGQKLFLRLCRF